GQNRCHLEETLQVGVQHGIDILGQVIRNEPSRSLEPEDLPLYIHVILPPDGMEKEYEGAHPSGGFGAENLKGVLCDGDPEELFEQRPDFFRGEEEIIGSDVENLPHGSQA